MPDARAYQLGDELGRGALGRVVRVRDPDGSRWAGKILHASHQDDARALARFESEARLVADLRHPNLVRVEGICEIDGDRVLLMELVEGPSLAELIGREAPLAPARVVAIGRGVASGLAAAHRGGLIHRDLKPANVLLTGDGIPKIADFGMARAASFAGIDADAFTVVGTPDYMAPEAIDPIAVDARSDVYALGCILHELAAGTPPFTGATAFAVLEAHRTAPVPALPDLPAELDQVIRWCLAKSPADRPQSAAAVERALGRLDRAAGLPAVAAAGALVARATCASCGAARVAEVAVCFGCGAAQVTIEAGRYTVFVTGPGQVAQRIDTAGRDRLLAWLRGNPTLGLDVDKLTRKLPRLPFVVVAGVAESSARGLADALGALGFECEVARGGPLSLRAMRKKARTMSGRAAAVVGGSTIFFWAQLGKLGVAILPIVGMLALVTMGTGVMMAREPMATRLRGRRAALPDRLSAALARIAGVVPAMTQARHRDNLRGVVDRALALRAALPVGENIDDDLAHLIDVAAVAASRLDELEQRLAAADLRSADDELRRVMRERDTWAARLLEITALLDALRVRRAAAAASDAGIDDDLFELRASIEALEEVQQS